MDTLTFLKTFRKKFKRKAQHKIYVYKSMLEMQNAAMRKLVRVSVKQDAIRKIRNANKSTLVTTYLYVENTRDVISY